MDNKTKKEDIKEVSNEKKEYDNTVTFIDNILTFLCPHCGMMVEVQKQQLNCKIFRHGIFKQNLNPLSVVLMIKGNKLIWKNELTNFNKN